MLQVKNETKTNILVPRNNKITCHHMKKYIVLKQKVFFPWLQEYAAIATAALL